MFKSSLVLFFKKELLAFLLAATSSFSAHAELKLNRVLLSSAGIGYFELGENAAHAATLGLDVKLEQVDDVLRSLVVFDDRGGVGSVELPGRDATRGAFADVPFGEAQLDSPAALLGSLRGEEIAVAGPAAMVGRIVSVAGEPVAQTAPVGGNGPPPTHTRVTLLTAEGFRQFILEDAASLRLTDAALAGRVGAALDAARTQAASSLRHLTLRMGGKPDGGGRVTIGYVTAVPLWKASYRLILPRSAGDRARLQGWAVLENDTGQDWNGVDLTLHSGNPVTFHQAIYTSYYADRPEVPVDVIGRVLPDADERVVAKVQQRLLQERQSPSGRAARDMDQMAPPPPPPQDAIPASAAAGSALMAAAPMAPPETQADTAETVLDTSFHLAVPVDLARGHTASVPILDRTLKAEQIDWLQANAARPITALRLTNDGGTSLPPGVLTLYTDDPKTGAAFAGDARLSGLPAGENRLLGFAEDLRMVAKRNAAPRPQALLHVAVADGIVHRIWRDRMAETVELTAPARDGRTILVEFAKSPGAQISFAEGVMPGQAETPRAWRVPMHLAAGETRKLTAYVDTARGEALALLSGNAVDDALLTELAGGAALDDKARAKLRPVLALRNALADRNAALKTLTAAQSAVLADEERLRANLRVVVIGDLHDRMLAQLNADELRLNELRAEMTAADAGVAAAQGALAKAVGALDL